MGRRSGVQGRAEWGVVAQQEDSIPTSVSTTFSSPQSHLVLGAPHREILLMQQTICVNGTRVMISEGAAFVVAAQSSASFLAVGAFHLSGDFQRFLQAIEPATDQVDSIGPENTTLMDPKFIAVKR